MTASECTETGGSPAGNCAAGNDEFTTFKYIFQGYILQMILGFGVCCLVALSGNCGTDQMVKQVCVIITDTGIKLNTFSTF